MRCTKCESKISVYFVGMIMRLCVCCLDCLTLRGPTYGGPINVLRVCPSLVAVIEHGDDIAGILFVEVIAVDNPDPERYFRTRDYVNCSLAILFTCLVLWLMYTYSKYSLLTSLGTTNSHYYAEFIHMHIIIGFEIDVYLLEILVTYLRCTCG